MCKFCDGSETPLARQETDHRDAEIRIDGNKLIADLRHDYLAAEIDFCPKCGTSLGEVEPLTAEQLRQTNGKPVWCKEFRMWAFVYIHDNWEPHLILSDGSPLINHPANRYTLFDREPKGASE